VVSLEIVLLCPYIVAVLTIRRPGQTVDNLVDEEDKMKYIIIGAGLLLASFPTTAKAVCTPYMSPDCDNRHS
jgi:hypothetical protein